MYNSILEDNALSNKFVAYVSLQVGMLVNRQLESWSFMS